MKNGTFYAGRLKRAYARHKQSTTKPDIPHDDEPLRRLAIGILGVENRNVDVERAVDRLMVKMIDWNEVRVSTVEEVQDGIDHNTIGAYEPCHNLIHALQAIYDKENKLSLDRLKSIGRREARQFLESLNGVSEYAVASVVLWTLGGHAIPVNDRLLQSLRDTDLVNPAAGRAEVQAFLERHIPAVQAKEFCIIMRTFRSGKRTTIKHTKTRATVKKKNTSKKKRVTR